MMFVIAVPVVVLAMLVRCAEVRVSMPVSHFVAVEVLDMRR